MMLTETYREITEGANKGTKIKNMDDLTYDIALEAKKDNLNVRKFRNFVETKVNEFMNLK